MPNHATIEAPSPATRSPGTGPGRDVADARHAAGEPQNSGSAATDRTSLHRYGLARLLDERGEIRPLEAVEEEMIRFAVEHCHGHIGEVARRLGMGRSTLYRKLRIYRIGDGSAASVSRDTWTK
jgi:DNA-binding NtrC family response regulator